MTHRLFSLVLFGVLATAAVAPSQAPADERAFGHVIDSAGKPLAGVRVALTDKKRPITAQVMATGVATSDARGRFSLSKRAVAHFGGGYLVLCGKDLATMKTTHRQIPGDVSDLGVFTMSRGVTLTGVVSDDQGKPGTKKTRFSYCQSGFRYKFLALAKVLSALQAEFKVALDIIYPR